MEMIVGESSWKDDVKRKRIEGWMDDQLRKFGRRPQHGVKKQFQAVMGHRMTSSEWSSLVQAKIKTLIIVGTSDELVRPSNSHYIGEKLGIKPSVIDGAGHAVMLDCPEILHALLIAHLKDDEEKEEVEKEVEKVEEEEAGKDVGKEDSEAVEDKEAGKGENTNS